MTQIHRVNKCCWKNGPNRLALMWGGHRPSVCRKCSICKAQFNKVRLSIRCFARVMAYRFSRNLISAYRYRTRTRRAVLRGAKRKHLLILSLFLFFYSSIPWYPNSFICLWNSGSWYLKIALLDVSVSIFIPIPVSIPTIEHRYICLTVFFELLIET